MQTRPARTFWWDRESPTEADVLRAVIFDADSVLAHIERDCDVAARTDLIDSVMSLFVAGIWVSVVSAGSRTQVETLVRQLLGDGLVETIVTIDDLPEPDAELARGGELYRLALWEMGITRAVRWPSQDPEPACVLRRPRDYRRWSLTRCRRPVASRRTGAGGFGQAV